MKGKEKESSEIPWPILVFILALGVLFRWAVACGPYSGQSKPPMFGDYEAQRHWMEITYALPIREWYFNTSDNNLQYWGLDYPPLTAYHSWILGAISHRIKESFVELHGSRGHESYEHKLFMRYSVLVADMLIFLPAVLVYVLRIQKKNADWRTKAYYLISWIAYPGLILVDYGHFQYNCVSLGFFVWAVIGIMTNHDLLGSIAFVSALSYKQMELYHAFPFFCYLLGTCFGQKSMLRGFWKLAQLGLIVLGTIAIVWFPFVTDPRIFAQVLHRLFPFARGIFEDKVANVWCALSVVIKWRKYFQVQQLVYLCGATTIACLLPMIILTIRTPTKQNFKWSLIISSLVFFLFSFQVHEKSILLAAIPMLICLHEDPLVVQWFLLTSVISLHPLCVKDQTQFAFFAFTLVYYVWISEFLDLGSSNKKSKEPRNFKHWLFHATTIIGLSICLASVAIDPPDRYPDLFPLMNSVLCCAQFSCFLVYFYWRMLNENIYGQKQKTQ